MSNYIKMFNNLCSEKPVSIKKALDFQSRLSKKVIRKNAYKRIDKIAGADLAILTKQKKLLCGVIVFSYPQLEIIEKAYSVVDEKFPYIPGLLSFREGPAIIDTLLKIKNKPDLVMLDGQGIAHPRLFGIACHVGVLLGIPAIGVGKKKLFGNYIEPEEKKGSRSDLIDKSSKETIGAVIRTRDGVKPVYVSIGNKIDLDSSVDIVLECSKGYRIPEPTRLADKYVAQLKREINL